MQATGTYLSLHIYRVNMWPVYSLTAAIAYKHYKWEPLSGNNIIASGSAALISKSDIDHDRVIMLYKKKLLYSAARLTHSIEITIYQTYVS